MPSFPFPPLLGINASMCVDKTLDVIHGRYSHEVQQASQEEFPNLNVEKPQKQREAHSSLAESLEERQETGA